MSFIRHLAKARARAEPAGAEAKSGARLALAVVRLACAAARPFAASLLERGVHGADGDTPSVHQVLNECRFAGLGLAA